MLLAPYHLLGLVALKGATPPVAYTDELINCAYRAVPHHLRVSFESYLKDLLLRTRQIPHSNLKNFYLHLAGQLPQDSVNTVFEVYMRSGAGQDPAQLKVFFKTVISRFLNTYLCSPTAPLC